MKPALAILLERSNVVPRELNCQVERSYEALDVLRHEWDQAVIDLEGPIYMSYDWTRLWWQFYGNGRQLRVFIFRASGRIVGIIPLYLDSIGLSPLSLRLARLVGACVPPKVFDPPIAEEWAEQIWHEVIRQLFGHDQCDLLSLGPIASDYRPAAALREACRQQAALVSRCESRPRDVRTLYHLPASYDEYLNSLDGKERKVRRKKLRDLEGAWPIRTEIVREAGAVEREFEMFAEQHAQQWQADGRPGHFHAWPDALEFNRALVKALGQLGRVRFYKLMAGEQVATNQYTYIFGRTLFAELPTRINGPEWERFSLGCTSQIKLIEAAIGDGVQRMESGLAHYEYKILTGGKESSVNMIHVVRKGALSRARVFCCRKLNGLLRLVLHKVWYRKIMPRLPAAFRGGQPRLLLRLDF